MLGFRQFCAGNLLVVIATWGGVLFQATSSAHATCGDFLAVTHGGDGDLSTDLIMREDIRDQVPSAPCRGPQCRSDNNIPDAPLPSVKIEVPRWGITLAYIMFPRRLIGPMPNEDGLCRSQYHRDPPLRPPRVG